MLLSAMLLTFILGPIGIDNVARADGTIITWTGGGTAINSWVDVGNWNLGRLPGPGDHVVIPIDASVNFNNTPEGVISISSIDCQGSLAVYTGTLNITDTLIPSTIKTLTVYSTANISGDLGTGTVHLRQDGTLSVEGDLSISTTFYQQAGTLTGSGTTEIKPGAMWRIGNGNIAEENRIAVISGGHTITNNGDAYWDFGVVEVTSDVTINNNGDFVVVKSGDGQITGGPVTFNNDGTISRNNSNVNSIGDIIITGNLYNSGEIIVNERGSIIINGDFTNGNDGAMSYHSYANDTNKLIVGGVASLQGGFRIYWDISSLTLQENDSFEIIQYTSRDVEKKFYWFSPDLVDLGLIVVPNYNPTNLTVTLEEPRLDSLSLRDTVLYISEGTDDYDLSQHLPLYGENQRGEQIAIDASSVSWTSSDTSIATVSGNTLHAVGEGYADLTAEIGGVTSDNNIKCTIKPNVIVWEGDFQGHGQWDEAANWNPQIVPGAEDNVYIPSGKSVTFDIGEEASLRVASIIGDGIMEIRFFFTKLLIKLIVTN